MSLFRLTKTEQIATILKTNMTTFNEVANLYLQISEEVKQKYPCLQSWQITWNSRLKNAMGRASRSSKGIKKIELSTKIVALNLRTPDFLNKIKETILHEWAHALDWEQYKGWSHGATWKKCMMSFGVRPERCFDGNLWLTQPNKANYVIRNSSTGRVWRYLENKPDEKVLTSAHHWHRVQLMRPAREELELIHLESGTFKTIE